MFVLLESKQEIFEARQKLEYTISKKLTKTIIKNIGYSGGVRRDVKVKTDGIHWFWSTDETNAANPRRLNWFGRLNKDQNLHISVEINTAYEGENRELAGLFARDTDTGIVYLMHSGRLGGGKKGVGKWSFLAWSNHILRQVMNGSGKYPDAIIVMPIEGKAATRSAIFYVESVANFKAAVTNGETTSKEIQQREIEYKDYYKEASGTRKGIRPHEFDYISRHGDIVHALYEWIKKYSLPHKHVLLKMLKLIWVLKLTVRS